MPMFLLKFLKNTISTIVYIYSVCVNVLLSFIEVLLYTFPGTIQNTQYLLL